MGATTALLLTGTGALGTGAAVGIGAGGAYAASKMMSGGKDTGISSPTPLPQPPSPVDSQSKGEDIARKKKAAMSQSVYTSPLGVAGTANVARKTLLGE